MNPQGGYCYMFKEKPKVCKLNTDCQEPAEKPPEYELATNEDISSTSASIREPAEKPPEIQVPEGYLLVKANSFMGKFEKCSSCDTDKTDCKKCWQDECYQKPVEKPLVSELHPNKKGREDCEDCPYPKRHCSECINGDNRAKVSQVFETAEKPASEMGKLYSQCNTERIDLQVRLDKAEAEKEEYRKCHEAELGVCFQYCEEVKDLKEKLGAEGHRFREQKQISKEQAERIKELEEVVGNRNLSINEMVVDAYMKMKE